MKCIIYSRASTTDQTTENQIIQLKVESKFILMLVRRCNCTKRIEAGLSIG